MLCSCNDFSDMMLFGQADFAKPFGLAIVAKPFGLAIVAKPFGLAYVASHMIQAVPPSGFRQADFAKQ